MFKNFCKTFWNVSRSQAVTLEAPTVVGHHVGPPSALVPLFHELNILKEPSSVLFTYVTKAYAKTI